VFLTGTVRVETADESAFMRRETPSKRKGTSDGTGDARRPDLLVVGPSALIPLACVG
jgi:hypothetical protein